MATPKDDVARQEQAKLDAAKAAETANAKAIVDAQQVHQTERDLEMESRRDNVKINNPRAPEAIAKQHEAVDAAKEKLNEHNREGHEKNMAQIEQDAAEAQARSEHGDDPRAKHTPTGKQQNHATPHVMPDGSKIWT